MLTWGIGRVWLVAAGWVMVAAAACGDGKADDVGDEGGACFADGTCNGTLVCMGNLCVAPSSVDGGAVVPESWVTIPAGTFTMGSPADELGRFDNETAHEVTLTRAFQLMTTAVTHEHFDSVMGYAPSQFATCGDDCAVETVAWHQAAAYANALSDLDGYARCYDCTDDVCVHAAAHASPYDCPGYRLPTEAEWEYAARAGDSRATYNGELTALDCTDTTLLPIAWFCGNAGDTPPAVAGKQPNEWGLYDMLGNVLEWTADGYDAYPSGAVTDPWGTVESHRVVRGGGWTGDATYARAAYRGYIEPGVAAADLGFRLARSQP